MSRRSIPVDENLQPPIPGCTAPPNTPVLGASEGWAAQDHYAMLDNTPIPLLEEEQKQTDGPPPAKKIKSEKGGADRPMEK